METGTDADCTVHNIAQHDIHNGTFHMSFGFISHASGKEAKLKSDWTNSLCVRSDFFTEGGAKEQLEAVLHSSSTEVY